ncbi:MAG: Uma2 family endonuclease [Micrococcales bacterium]|nr:Uma2 family endonuclease [Micrococcales bacterium]MCL2668378.1 Uma2 family endonuclease [Micrococcales bacterium]
MSTAAAWPLDLLTLDEWDSLPVHESHRVECVEGVLVVSPRPSLLHQQVMLELARVLAASLPGHLVALPEIDVLVDEEPLTMRSPDIAVIERAAAQRDIRRASAADVVLVVEILSDGSRRTDRVTKLSEYAEAQIPEYWLVDPDAGRLLVHTLSAGQYVLSHDCTGLVTLTVAGADINVDISALGQF